MPSMMPYSSASFGCMYSGRCMSCGRPSGVEGWDEGRVSGLWGAGGGEASAHAGQQKGGWCQGAAGVRLRSRWRPSSSRQAGEAG